MRISRGKKEIEPLALSWAVRNFQVGPGIRPKESGLLGPLRHLSGRVLDMSAVRISEIPIDTHSSLSWSNRLGNGLAVGDQIRLRGLSSAVGGWAFTRLAKEHQLQAVVDGFDV